MLLLLVLAIACFIGGWLAPWLVALFAAGLLMATSVLTPNEALAGFGSPALITLVGLICSWCDPLIAALVLLWLFSLGVVSQTLLRWFESPC